MLVESVALEEMAKHRQQQALKRDLDLLCVRACIFGLFSTGE